MKEYAIYCIELGVKIYIKSISEILSIYTEDINKSKKFSNQAECTKVINQINEDILFGKSLEHYIEEI